MTRKETQERVRARLWEDPLQAIYSAPESQATDRLQLVKGVKDELSRFPVPERRILVLPVLTHGQPYPDEQENRLRLRYSIVSGLLRCGYVAVDPGHVGFFIAGKKKDAKPTSKPTATKKTAKATGSDTKKTASGQPIWTERDRIGFEWFEAETLRIPEEAKAAQPAGLKPNEAPRYSRALILWINEDSLGAEPFRRIIQTLQVSLTGVGNLDSGALQIRIIGPTSSNGALALARNATRWFVPRQAPEDSKVRTIETFTDFAANTGLTFLSPWVTMDWNYLSFQTDSGLIAKGDQWLLGESGLPLQPIALPDSKIMQALVDELRHRNRLSGRVALIYEADTIYGRALLKTFLAATKQVQGLEIVPFRFLRGLDGQQIRGDAKSHSSDDDPSGFAQLDYLRRLERDLAAHDRFDAVGILGSDTFDKIVLLQALSGLDPSTLFFTTDLDAKFSYRKHYPFARNLLTAASFGLRLNETYQRSTPPFRDSYQTACYYSTLIACGLADYRKPQPQLFEIGKHGPVRLTQKQEKKGDASAVLPNPETNWADPRFKALTRNWYWFLLAVALSLVGIWLLNKDRLDRFRANCKAVSPRLGTIADRCSIGIPAAAAAGVIFFCVVAASPGGEPLRLFDGVSVWPSEFIRILAAGITGFYILMALEKLGTRDAEIAADFGFRDSTDENERSSHTAWATFTAYETLGKRVRTAAIMTGVGAAAVFILQETFADRVAPIRDSWTRFGDESLSWVLTGIVLYLLALVVHATMRCEAWVKALERPLQWDATQRQRFASAASTGERTQARLLELNLLGELTEPVGRVLYYPFLTLFLVVLARFPVFDLWPWPNAFVVPICLAFAVPIYHGMLLHRRARAFRERALDEVLEERDAGVLTEDRARAFEAAISTIRDYRVGAFSDYQNNPVVRAVLIPSSGVGLLAALDLFIKSS